MYATWSCMQCKGNDKDVGFGMWPSIVLVIEQVLCNMIVSKKEGGDQVASNLVMHVSNLESQPSTMIETR